MNSRGGFTLLELLVSMAILSIIVMLTAQIFEQSTVAWNSGARRVEVNMTGRAIADFIAQEISQAVEDHMYHDFFAIKDGPMGSSRTDTQFVVLDRSDGTNRIARWVQYSFDGSLVRRATGSVLGSIAYDGAWSSSGLMAPLSPDPGGGLTPAIVGVELSRYPTGPAGEMPRYVDVKIKVVSSYDIGKGSAFENTFTSRAYMVNRNRYRY